MLLGQRSSFSWPSTDFSGDANTYCIPVLLDIDESVIQTWQYRLRIQSWCPMSIQACIHKYTWKHSLRNNVTKLLRGQLIFSCEAATKSMVHITLQENIQNIQSNNICIQLLPWMRIQKLPTLIYMYILPHSSHTQI